MSPGSPTGFPALPAHTVERWRQIVRRAALSGADISALVQHFAERAFQNKTSDLEQQGSRRRALTQMCVVVNRELARAQAARAKYAEPHKTDLARAFEGVRIAFFTPQTDKTTRKRRQGQPVPLAMDGATQASKSSPLAEKITTVAALDAYCGALTAQAAQLSQEMRDIDVVLNRGILNHQGTVDELSATSLALWAIAQDVVLELGDRVYKAPSHAAPPAPAAAAPAAIPELRAAQIHADLPPPAKEALQAAPGDLLRTVGNQVSRFFKKWQGPNSGNS